MSVVEANFCLVIYLIGMKMVSTDLVVLNGWKSGERERDKYICMHIETERERERG